ncbi:Cell division protein sepF [Syntrophobotulus glycolicus DSM 8271]|uniref:Cell division protein SepF n=1 Tax=Syntrophobotulus glycolicus (strain DSM 8271 / FlGlyR) TaxID=645991 RepID=F0T012_SYNGF|nr:cell division protein SepF [Syntrophobotulus glycolicus]ADY55023.1 Cell division protein sepF [Syntrophobotulus glycolicus DSM 8271]
MGNLLDKFIGIMGFGDDQTDDELAAAEFEEDYEDEEPRFKTNTTRDNFVRESAPRETALRDAKEVRHKSSPVVSIHTQKQVRVMIVEPSSFEETQNIAEHLKSRRAVVVNLEKTDSSITQRIVDFVCGTTYALGGNMQKIGNGIFMFVPNNVDISGETSFKMTDREIIWPKMNH